MGAGLQTPKRPKISLGVKGCHYTFEIKDYGNLPPQTSQNFEYPTHHSPQE